MKKIVLGVLLFITTIAAIILNFNSALQGRTAILFDFLVTVIYLGVWIFVFWYAIKHKEYNLLLPSIAFWFISLLTVIGTIIINISDMTINFLIPFVMVFLTPLYGIRILGVTNITALIIMAIITIYFIVYGLYCFGKEKGKFLWN